MLLNLKTNSCAMFTKSFCKLLQKQVHFRSLSSTKLDDIPRFLNKIKFLTMPKLSPTMDIGTIEKWHIYPGEQVHQYQLVLDVSASGLTMGTQETGEKVHMEIELMEDMYVAKLLRKPGEECPTGTPIALFCDDQADMKTLQNMDTSTLVAKYTVGDVVHTTLWQGYVKAEESKREDVGCGCS